MRVRLLAASLSIVYPMLAASSASRYNETSLILRDIFASYDKRVLPLVAGPLVVNMTIVLGILIELRENQQLASFVISHTQRWFDRRLKWNPTLYSGQQQVIVPQSMVWLPKLFVYNSLETKEMLTSNRADVRVYANGLVKANLPQHVSCICRLSIENFPFDVQFCAVALASPLLTVSEMVASTSQPPTDSYFAGNAEWLLFNVTVRQMEFLEENEYRIEIHYIFQLQRRPIYYITVIVAPTFLISALSILGIFAPASNDGPRGEKVSLGLGSLLAMTVLLGIVAGAMPKSNEIPLLGYYILIVICLCAVAVAISMAFLAFTKEYITSGRPPSKSTLRFFRIHCVSRSNRKGTRQTRLPSGAVSSSSPLTPTSCLLNSKRKCASGHGYASHGNGSTIENEEQPQRLKFAELGMINTALEEIVDAQRSTKARHDARIRHKEIEELWSRVFSRFDYVFLFIFQSLNLAALGVFLRVAWLPVPELKDQQLL